MNYYIQISSVSSGSDSAALSALRPVLSSDTDGAAIVDLLETRLSEECTHLIVGTKLRKTEKVLVAMARGGVKIVTVHWAHACVAAGSAVSVEPYTLLGPSPEYPTLPPPERRGGRFEGWKCLVVLEDAKMKDIYARILRAGGAAVAEWTVTSLNAELKPESSGNDAVTHIFSEPKMANAIAYSNFFRTWRSAGVTATSYFYVGVILMQEEDPALENYSIWRPMCARMHLEMKAAERRRRVRALDNRKKRAAAAARAGRAVNSDDDGAEDAVLTRNLSQTLAPDDADVLRNLTGTERKRARAECEKSECFVRLKRVRFAVTESSGGGARAKLSFAATPPSPSKSPRKRVTRRTREHDATAVPKNGVTAKETSTPTAPDATPAALSDLSNLSSDSVTDDSASSARSAAIEVTLRRAAARRSIVYGSDLGNAAWMRFESRNRRNEVPDQDDDEDDDEEDKYDGEDAYEDFFANALDTYGRSADGDEISFGGGVNLWNLGMVFIGEAVSSVRLKAQIVQKLLIEGVLDQTDIATRNAVAELLWRMVLSTHPPVTAETALAYLRAMTRARIDDDPSKPWHFVSGIMAEAAAQHGGSEGNLLALRLVTDVVRVNFENWSQGRTTEAEPLVQRILWLPGESSATLSRNLKDLVELYSESVESGCPAASKLISGLLAAAAQFLCKCDALDGSNKRKDALVSFALGCLKGPVAEGAAPPERLWAQLQMLKPAWLSFNLGFRLLVAANHLQGVPPVDRVGFKMILGLVQALTDCDGVPSAQAQAAPCPTVRPSPQKSPSKINVVKRNHFGETRVHLECKKGNAAVLRLCLATPGVDVNARDHNGWTPMHEAVAGNHADCALALLEYNPRTIDSFFGGGGGGGGTRSDKRRMGVDLLATDSERGSGVTPLHEAVSANYVDLVATILDYVATHPGRFPPVRELLTGAKNGEGASVREVAATAEMAALLDAASTAERGGE